jgi:hypothetical protein
MASLSPERSTTTNTWSRFILFYLSRLTVGGQVTFHFDGEKIIKLNEFVDSKYSSAYFGALRAEAAE